MYVGFGALLALEDAPASAQESPPWTLVQPLTRTDMGSAIANHFATVLPRYLGAPVSVHAPTAGKGLESLTWASQPAVSQRTLVLMSSSWWSRVDERGGPGWGAASWVPLQMVLQGSWCLLAAESPQFSDFQTLQAWLRTLRRPVRLGVLHRFGMSEVWMQAMARKTDLPWQSLAYGRITDAMDALRERRVDLLLDRCAAIAKPLGRAAGAALSKMDSPPLQVLAHSGQHHAWSAPSFAQWHLPPLEAGWVAWFAPAGMPTILQKRAAQALQAMVQREDTQELITSLHYVPTRWSNETSRTAVQKSLHEGRLLREWVQAPVAAGESQP